MRLHPAFGILLLIGLGAPAPARSFEVLEVIPERPMALQPVRIRTQVGGCEAQIGAPRIEGDLIRINIVALAKCTPPPPPRDVEISLGSLPAGRYRVSAGGEPRAFEVLAPPFSATRRALDETGVWWDPRFRGTGVMVFDVFGGRRVVMFATYDSFGLPVFYTMLIGSDAFGAGTLYASRGTPAGAAPGPGDFESFEAGSGSLFSVGSDRLQFRFQLIGGQEQVLMLERFPL
jgi:hypothetical protein